MVDTILEEAFSLHWHTREYLFFDYACCDVYKHHVIMEVCFVLQNNVLVIFSLINPLILI